jgi:hypothetical protein
MDMSENEPRRPWYRTWFLRSLVLIGIGLVMLVCALLVPPTKEFDPDLPPELDDEERFALLGVIALSVGIATTLVCAIAWLAIRMRKAVQAGRE